MERQPFSVCEAPLSGTTLIEASAGTGKTQTITDLYVRLLLETGHPVSQILVVTFTTAATAELRDRLRRRLVEAYQVFSGQQIGDAFCQQLSRVSSDQQLAAQRLDNALQEFDEAAIYTIHSFCERALAEGAFESGMLFEHTLLPDEREILQEVVDDFWRRTVHEASPLFVRYLLTMGVDPEQLFDIIQPHIGKPYLKVVPPASAAGAWDEPTRAQLETAFATAHGAVRALWQTAASAVEQILSTSTTLNRTKYRRDSIPGWIRLLDDYLALDTPHPELCERFERFTARHLATAVKKGEQPPQHPFFTACDSLAAAHAPLQAAYAQALHAVKVALFTSCQDEIGVRKRRRRLLSYDDLLLNLERALVGPRGPAYAEAIRRRYAAALIDEFQDTDPVQYRIFQQIYHGTTAPVFFVGDPKQAIYSFRGADVFAYLHACDAVDQCYTLETNWRSDPGLIKAIYKLFDLE
jgi:exodeoxyribonuclease V beta subunit